MIIQQLLKILSKLKVLFRRKRYRSEKADFISSHAFFYKILGRDKTLKDDEKSKNIPLKEK